MAMIELTWKQIKNFGLEKKVIEWKGWDYYRVMEHGIPDGELIEFDDEFENPQEPENVNLDEYKLYYYHFMQNKYDRVWGIVAGRTEDEALDVLMDKYYHADRCELKLIDKEEVMLFGKKLIQLDEHRN